MLVVIKLTATSSAIFCRQKDGWPQDYAPAAVVVANTATEADAIATALSAQSASAGIDWVNQLSGVEALNC